MTARLTNARTNPLDDGALAPLSSAVESAAPRRGRLVLVIDEFDVTACSRPEDALESIAAGLRLDVILCDMVMPGLSGMDVHASLLRDRPEQERRLLFVTGGSTHADHETFLHGNGDRCVPALTRFSSAARPARARAARRAGCGARSRSRRARCDD
jgi:CheY-like chemotaxis protein